MLTSCLQEQASKDVVACQVAWPPAGPLDNRTATTGAANRHLFGFDRNRVRFEPESLFAITGMRTGGLRASSRAPPGCYGRAVELGTLVAQRDKEKGVTKVVFDRGGYLYHGRIKALADAAREAGLEF